MVDDFKHTDAGLIPHEWEASPISDLFKFKQGVQCPVEKQFKSDADGLKRFIRIIDLTDSTEPIRYISDPGESHHVKKDDLFMVRYGSPGLLGFGFKGVIANNLFRLLPKKELSTNFYYHYLSYISDKILAISGSSTMPAISFSSLNDLPIVVPPTKAEQTAIATALNDADALITALEKLIAKKKAIKQGAMQELLKPKGGWKPTTVAKLGSPFGGLSGKSKADFKNGNSPYIPFMNVMSNPIIDTTYFDFVKIGASESQNRALKGDLFFNGSSETPEELGMCSVLLEDIQNLYLNSFCFGFRLFHPEKTNGLYLAYFFRSSYGRQIFQILSQGATRHNLSKSNFLKTEILIPEPPEQKEIAEIIYDMDNEIHELEQKLEKQKQIKQGMMQVLLTGKIRLM